MGRRYAGALAALVAISAALRFWAASGVPTPWIAPDEMLYALLGRSLWTHGSLDVLGRPTPYYSLVYPALAGLPLSLGSVHAGYTALKAVQAATMSLAAVPVFLWGRRLMRPGFALAAAALTLAIPGLVYSGAVMTETAFYPLLVTAAWATAAAVERPTARRQALLLAACALCVLTRLQALVLVAAVPTAVLVEALLARRPRRALGLWPVGAAALATALFYALRGSAGLGGYSAAAGSYGAADAARFVAYHAADLLLVCGVLPACAVAIQLVDAVRGRERDPAGRAYLAVAVSFSVWMVLEVGVFASEHAHRIEERDLLGLAPILFLGLALWLDRGAPRRYAIAAVVALAAAALLVTLPLDRFVGAGGVPDSPTFAAVWRHLAQRPSIDATLVVAVPAVALAAAFALLPRRLLPLTPALLLVAFAVASVSASAQFRDESAVRSARLLGPDPTWIDRAVAAPTAYLYAGGGYWNAVWANLFWNRRLERVWDLPGTRVPGPMPQRTLAPGGSGALPDEVRFAVAPSSVRLDGRRVARSPLRGSDEPALSLWALARPARLLLQTSGFQPNGDVYVRGEARAYACSSGSFVATLLGKTDETVDVLLDGRVVRRVPLRRGESAQVIVPVPPRRGSCVLALVPSAAVGVTQIGFAR